MEVSYGDSSPSPLPSPCQMQTSEERVQDSSQKMTDITPFLKDECISSQSVEPLAYSNEKLHSNERDHSYETHSLPQETCASDTTALKSSDCVDELPQQTNPEYLDDHLVQSFMMLAMAYGNPGYEDFEISDALKFFARRQSKLDISSSGLDAEATLSKETFDQVDNWLKSLRIVKKERIGLIVERPFPHQDAKKIDMAHVRRTKGRRMMKATRSEHGNPGHWWRSQIKRQDMVLLAASLFASFPVRGLPNTMTQQAIMGTCDHFSPASHGAAYRAFPPSELQFILDYAHYQNWCRRCTDWIL